MIFAIKRRAPCALILWATGLFYPLLSHAVIPVQHWTQASGAKVYLIESPAIAMVDVQLDFDAGSRRVTADRSGLAGVTASLLSKGVAARGGAPALDENALGEAWADLGAQFGASAGADRFSFSLRSLTEPELLDQAVKLAARQIAEPSFPADIWESDRQRLVANLKESYTRPASVVSREFGKVVYSGHPYGYEVNEATLNRIGVADMRAFHSAYITRCNVRVNIVGALSRAKADELVTGLLSRLPAMDCATAPPLPVVPEVPPLDRAQVLRIPFDAAQAHVMIGQPGYTRDDPDFFPLTVGNYILGGGGAVSRLTQEVREKRGLSYSVFSYFSPGRHAGAFTLGLQTRPDQAAQAMEVAQQVLARFVAEGPTAAELKAAKDNLIGGFPLLIDSNRKLLGNLSNISWNDLPLNYLDGWTDKIANVSAAEVRAAFARKLQPEKMVTVILGATP
ncbi:pitrilysin family protein [Polaromonas sp. A23]|uniref:M16 family metallopeptidase n=1 Tax=Polaromonas sp. A23 TaxID=1944133 RepID=UPI00098710B7|nr:peptidase M16 [Polaromonas sp. A23]